MNTLRKWRDDLRARLIDDLHHSWRLWSVQIPTVGALLLGLWNMLPDELHSRVPPRTAIVIATGLFVLTAVSRIFKQRGKHDGDE